LKIFFKAAALAICLSLAASGALAEDPAAKAASVNGTIISEKELAKELDLLLQRMAREGRQLPEEKIEEVRGKVLDNMIDMELLAQESRKKNITVDPAAVESQMQAFRQRFGSPERFADALSDMGLTEKALETRVRDNMAVRELISREIEPGVSVSEKEARMFYEQNTTAFREPEKVRARHILVKVGPETDREKARQKIDAIRKRLENGEDFAAVAAETSEGPSRSQGGDLGFFGRGQMVKPFEDAAFSLEKGKISPVVETRFGYHVIQVTDRQPEKTLSFEEVEAKLTDVLRREKIKVETRKYVEGLRQSAKIERF
jgi:peptidyl-prolyl cis-trans isomerase C